ncbi:phosphoribosylformylglycinamidine cyclo-ligase [Desulfatitalea alkaliphila]|uniref:Phosphoribosylformylglycinamidine cyclo-ligase n=1 Tax=Desulfatitalea alkaliphila TaxID=2929485 RepID=A0AA41RC32_9BACT|nr:phosphoribosylformylglycinamidine cyclo-ligase [Desulfatitalea alkaliphila]MCJ8502373.1 phosphoribosylformylglycinamidine cyclo-ligase [Desulfatitalea alkaliphila]
MDKPLTYSDAGVDIDKADALVNDIKDIARKTRVPGVMGEIGGFGGLFSLNVANMESPVLVSSTDGVGTKLKIAFMMDKHDTVGIDLVAMCVNDVAVQGAKPLFFLDYLATGRIRDEQVKQIVAGVGQGCQEARCALIGGETAEMPGFYADNEYDLAGFAVGIVDNSKIVDGSEIQVGDQLVGVAASGLHSNGFSLVRKICFDRLKLDVHTHVPALGRTLGEELLTPTRIYSETIQSLLRGLPIRGLAHITGGGIVNNTLRIIPRSCGLRLRRGSWEIPPIFGFLQEAGGVAEKEMMRVFNNGIGLVAVVPETAVQDVLARLSATKEKAFVIGEIVEHKGSDDERCRWE